MRYKDWECTIRVTPFAANKRKNKCIILLDSEDGQQIAKANVFLEGLEPNQVAIDTNNNGYELIQALQNGGIIKDKQIGQKQSGYCTYPVFELTDRFGI